MAYAEWKGKRQDHPCVFEAFFRKAPFQGRYTVFGGLDEVLNFLSNYKFEPQHISYLKQELPYMEDGFFQWLSNLSTSSLKVYGIPTGTIVFADEPLLRIEGPFALLQLIETPLLNLINFASLISTNASRMKMISGDTKCVEFGLRRAQGPNGALTASKYAIVGGFEGSSNVQAGFACGVPIVGTLAHSMIMSFENEDDCKDSRHVSPKNGGDPVDLLKAALSYRDQLGWHQT